MAETIGKVTHYYDKLGVAIVKLDKVLKVGEEVHIKGATTDQAVSVDSMQYDHKDIEEGAAGQEVGIKVADKVREGDAVTKG